MGDQVYIIIVLDWAIDWKTRDRPEYDLFSNKKIKKKKKKKREKRMKQETWYKVYQSIIAIVHLH